MMTWRTAGMIAFALAVNLLLLPAIISAALPAKWWFEVRQVLVEPNTDVNAIRVIPDRTIKTGPFGLWVEGWWGAWRTEIRRVVGDQFEPFGCARDAPELIHYRPNNRVPEGNLLVPWWLNIPPNENCAWRPGEYSAETVWTIYPFHGLTPIPIPIRTNPVRYTFTILPDPSEKQP